MGGEDVVQVFLLDEGEIISIRCLRFDEFQHIGLGKRSEEKPELHFIIAVDGMEEGVEFIVSHLREVCAVVVVRKSLLGKFVQLLGCPFHLLADGFVTGIGINLRFSGEG